MRYTKVINIMMLILIVALPLYAADFAYKCADCHDSPKKIVPKGHADVKTFSNCFDCHYVGGKGPKLGSRVHTKHLGDMGISEDTCLACHKLGADNTITINAKDGVTMDKDELADAADKFKTYYENGKLANSHKNSGQYCLSCHETFDEDDVDAIPARCIKCHGGYDVMQKVTEKTTQTINPHKHHFPSLACTKCHQAHDSFTDYCAKCHKWNFTWQQKVKNSSK